MCTITPESGPLLLVMSSRCITRVYPLKPIVKSVKKIENLNIVVRDTKKIGVKSENNIGITVNQKIQDINRFKMTIPHRAEERVGVIKDWDLPLEDLREEIEPGQGVISIERLKKRVRVEKRFVMRDSHLILVKFAGCSLPTKLIVMGEVGLNITPFVRNIRQCYNCLKFGHIKKWCRSNTKRYFNCGDAFHGECSKEARYINCEEGHGALNRDCPYAVLEKAITKLMAYKNVSFQEAKQQAMLELGFVDKRLKYRDAEEQNDFYGNNKDFPSLDRFKKKKIIVEKWEDQPCDLRHPFWKHVKPKQQARSDRNKGEKYRLDTQNGYESLSEEEDQGNYPTQSRKEDTTYADKVKSNQKNNRRSPNKEKNTTIDKRQKHTDYDIEQLLQWIREEELEDVVLKRLKTRGRYSSEQMEKMWGKVDSNLKRLDRNVQRQIRSYNYSKLPKHITGDNLVDDELEEMRRKEEEKKRAFLYRNKRQDTGCRRQNFRGTDRNETYHNKHENKDWNQPNKVDKLMPEWKKAEEQPTTGKPKEKEEFATRVFEILLYHKHRLMTTGIQMHQRRSMIR
ncbi:uncharacterized protein LOC128894229 isoform X2 [Hylaeus anthracinus]|uniref:uncharacterized protein LOC128894229 isoform X2 n=1 Tax=Hylaeus anthracinus TaxID=313031 RepID=UPI0023B97833|nr:uncharacterized protein LOC128894229 isoform X2 [Hylaeus anthracinus]